MIYNSGNKSSCLYCNKRTWWCRFVIIGFFFPFVTIRFFFMRVILPPGSGSFVLPVVAFRATIPDSHPHSGSEILPNSSKLMRQKSTPKTRRTQIGPSRSWLRPEWPAGPVRVGLELIFPCVSVTVPA